MRCVLKRVFLFVATVRMGRGGIYTKEENLDFAEGGESGGWGIGALLSRHDPQARCDRVPCWGDGEGWVVVFGADDSIGRHQQRTMPRRLIECNASPKNRHLRTMQVRVAC